MNGLANLAHVLETGKNEILIDAALGLQAKKSIDRMLDFAKTVNLTQGQMRERGALTQAKHGGVGPA